MTAHLVIIKGTQFFDAKIEGYRDMDLTDILQMMGRAGRPAYDTTGTAIVYTKESKKMFYKHFLNVGFPVESSLHKVLDDHLGAEITSGSITNKQEALDFLSWTFLFRRAHHNPTYYGIEDDTSTAGVSEHLSSLIDSTLENLRESQCVLLHGDDIVATPFLSISSYYYISHLTIRQLLKQIHDHATFQEVLRWLSLAVEYNELPVRGGEIIMNEEMSQQSRYSVESTFTDEFELPMWDPHVKTFLLLQAHLSRVDLPIADYIQDTVSVLDQSLRILQAYIDVASELGYFHTVLTMIKMMQCIKQGYWYEDDPVSVLPGLQLRRIKDYTFSEQGFIEMTPQQKKKKLLTLEEIGRFGYKKLLNVFDQLTFGMTESEDTKKRFVSVCQRLPVLEGMKFEEQENNEVLTFYSKHLSSKHNNGFEVYCDKFPKIQKELWFLIGHKGDELLMIKRCQPKQMNKEVIIHCDLFIPEEIRGEELQFSLINDALGLRYDMVHKLIS